MTFLILKNLALIGKPEQTLEVTNALKIDVTGGEQDCEFRIWKDMIDRR